MGCARERTASIFLVWACVLGAATALIPSAATAAINAASVLDGPSAGILDVDGAAAAPDGTGAVVYRKLSGGVARVFVSQFYAGHWRAPIQVDTGQPFGASTPRIAAADGGMLLVVWAEPWAQVNGNTQYELMSAVLDPGAEAFGRAIVVDPEIGDASAADPSLSMAANGRADVAYRVVTDNYGPGSISTVPQLRPGDELMDVRVARFNGLTWSSLGALNRNPQATMRAPTESNAPVIATEPSGNAVVVWQEPELDGVARIWARRIFGRTLGNVLQISPASLNGTPLTTDADAPALAVSAHGEARIAYRLQGGVGSPFGVARLFTDVIAGESEASGAQPAAVTLVEPVLGAAALGPPNVSINLSQGASFALTDTENGAALLVRGNSSEVGSPVTLGGSSSEPSLTTLISGGGATTVWPTNSSAGLPVVEAREDFAGGSWQQAQLAGAISGAISDVSLGGSGGGGALLGFEQGAPGQEQVVGAAIQAPPAPFKVNVPTNWVRSTRAVVSWEPPPAATGAITYSVLVAGQVEAKGLHALALRLSSRGLGDGVHPIQVLASDASGQQTMSGASTLKVDANPPTVGTQVKRKSLVARIVVHDAGSGGVAKATTIAWGDGAHTNGKLTARHTYRRPGPYTLTVAVRDKAGNHAVVHVRVSVPAGQAFRSSTGQ